MNKDKYVFAQMTEYLDYPKFRRLVRKYRGDSYVKRFTCWSQLLTLMFGQLSGRESLHDPVTVLEAHQSKCYHLGLGDRPASRNAVSLANQTRDCRIFEEFASFMMEEGGRECAADVFGLGGNVYAFDSTTIPLCLSLFPWARFRRHKGGVKAHVLYELETHVPSFYHITAASAHDSKAMPTIPYETGSYYVFDRGCNAFAELHRINRLESFFIVRAKQNLKSRCVRWRRRLPKDVLGDTEIVFTEEASLKKNREAPAGEVPRQGASPFSRMPSDFPPSRWPVSTGADGWWNYSSGGSSNTSGSRSSGERPRTPCGSRSAWRLPFFASWRLCARNLESGDPPTRCSRYSASP